MCCRYIASEILARIAIRAASSPRSSYAILNYEICTRCQCGEDIEQEHGEDSDLAHDAYANLCLLVSDQLSEDYLQDVCQNPSTGFLDTGAG